MVESVVSEAVRLCLDNWTALKLAVDMGWGEEEAKTGLINDLTRYILDFEVERDDIRCFLEDEMEDRFSVLLEDNSASDIADILLKVFKENMEGKSEEIQKLRKIQGADCELSQKAENRGIVQQMEDMTVEPPKLVDEDGFETVVSKKQKKK